MPPADSIFCGSVTNLLSILCLFAELISRVYVTGVGVGVGWGGGGGEVCVCVWGGGGKLNDFKFVTFIGLFQSDGAESMAVKGLNVLCSKAET